MPSSPKMFPEAKHPTYEQVLQSIWRKDGKTSALIDSLLEGSTQECNDTLKLLDYFYYLDRGGIENLLASLSFENSARTFFIFLKAMNQTEVVCGNPVYHLRFIDHELQKELPMSHKIRDRIMKLYGEAAFLLFMLPEHPYEKIKAATSPSHATVGQEDAERLISNLKSTMNQRGFPTDHVPVGKELAGLVRLLLDSRVNSNAADNNTTSPAAYRS